MVQYFLASDKLQVHTVATPLTEVVNWLSTMLLATCLLLRQHMTFLLQWGVWCPLPTPGEDDAVEGSVQLHLRGRSAGRNRANYGGNITFRPCQCHASRVQNLVKEYYLVFIPIARSVLEWSLSFSKIISHIESQIMRPRRDISKSKLAIASRQDCYVSRTT